MPSEAGGRIAVGVVGATGRGDYGHELHEAFREQPDADVVAVTDLESAAQAAARAEALGARGCYTDHREMLEHEALDVAVVATRYVDRHEQLVTDLARAGVHILCEKPLSRSLDEADRMVAAAESAGVLLANSLPWRNEKRAVLVAELMADPSFGEVTGLSAVCKCDHRGGGQDFLVLGLHFADMMRQLLGDPLRCDARVRRHGRLITTEDVHEGAEAVGLVAGDHIHSTYEFADGVVGTITSLRAGIEDRAAQPYRLFVSGTRGIISIRAPYADDSVWFYPDPVLRPDGPPWQRIETTRTRAYAEYHHPAAADLVDAIRQRREPRCSGHDGRAALEMILAAYASSRRRGPVDLPLEQRAHPLIAWTP